jgi:hypothetical protein
MILSHQRCSSVVEAAAGRLTVWGVPRGTRDCDRLLCGKAVFVPTAQAVFVPTAGCYDELWDLMRREVAEQVAEQKRCEQQVL